MDIFTLPRYKASKIRKPIFEIRVRERLCVRSAYNSIRKQRLIEEKTLSCRWIDIHIHLSLSLSRIFKIRISNYNICFRTGYAHNCSWCAYLIILLTLDTVSLHIVLHILYIYYIILSAKWHG